MRQYRLALALLYWSQPNAIFWYPTVLIENCAPAVLLPALTAGNFVRRNWELSVFSGSEVAPEATLPIVLVTPPRIIHGTPPELSIKTPVAGSPSPCGLLKVHWPITAALAGNERDTAKTKQKSTRID